MKFVPPCKVKVDGLLGAWQLRRVERSTPYLKSKGLKGNIAYIQNRDGTTVVEYRRLKPASKKMKKTLLQTHGKEGLTLIETPVLVYEKRKCLKCNKVFDSLGKLRNDRWFRIEWLCGHCKKEALFLTPGLGRFEGASVSISKSSS